ncbi:hypothetical protein DVH05_027601 [Phytophthora capsici]|nr:hypothetical protein DVH05_027601 [Phytophthora capsici]
MEEVYKNVLKNLQVQELHRSCNDVLQEEFALVVAAVDHVAEAFAKLEEVSDAVDRLQQDQKSTGCSASLMETTANSFKLQQELEKRVVVLARGMTVEKLPERKRKREQAVDGLQPSTKVQANVNSSEGNGRCAFSSTSALEKNDKVSRHDVTESRVMTKAEPEVSKNGGSNATAGYSATALATIVDDVNHLSREDRAFVVPDVVIALKKSIEDDKEMTQASAVATSLNVMVQWWTRKHESQVRHLEVYYEYAEALRAYVARLPPSQDKMNIERLLNALTSSIRAVKGVPMPSAVKTRAQTALSFKFPSLIASLGSLSFDERQTHLLRILVAFKKDTASKVNDKSGKRFLKPMNTIFRWMFQYLREPYHATVCRMLVEAARQASTQILDASGRNSVNGLLDRVSAVLTDPSSRETRKFLDDIHAQAANVLNRLKECKRRTVPNTEVDKLLAVVKELVEHTTYGWDGRQDPTTLECVNELKQIVMKNIQRNPKRLKELLGAISKLKSGKNAKKLKI